MGGKLSSKTILNTQEKETFLWRDFLCGRQTAGNLSLDEVCLGSQGPSQTNLPGNGLGGIPRHPLFSTQPFWGLWGLRVLTSYAPLLTGQRGTQESGSLWGTDVS